MLDCVGRHTARGEKHMHACIDQSVLLVVRVTLHVRTFERDLDRSLPCNPGSDADRYFFHQGTTTRARNTHVRVLRLRRDTWDCDDWTRHGWPGGLAAGLPACSVLHPVASKSSKRRNRATGHTLLQHLAMRSAGNRADASHHITSHLGRSGRPLGSTGRTGWSHHAAAAHACTVADRRRSGVF